MDRDTRPVRMLCNLLGYFDNRILNQHPSVVRENLLKLPGLMMYQLGNWWSGRVDMSGLIDPILDKKKVLGAPYFRIYEEVLSSFVSGWENSKPEIANLRRRNNGFEWEDIGIHASLCVKHINETAKLLVNSVNRGDLVAAEWMADVLCKWWGNSSNYYAGYFNGISDFVTIDDLNLGWEDFCSKFGLTVEEFKGHEVVIKESIFYEALKNYLIDILILVFEIFLERIRSLSSEKNEESLTVYIAKGIMNGKKWRAGSQFFESLFPSCPDDYLIAKFRQITACNDMQGSYLRRLNSFVDEIRDGSRSPMIGSRVYSFSGPEGVEELIDSSLDFLLILTKDKWDYPPKIIRKMSSLIFSSREGVNGFDSFERFIFDLNQRLDCRASIDNFDFSRWDRFENGLAKNISGLVKDSLSEIKHRNSELRRNAISSGEIDINRLKEIEIFSSVSFFEKDKSKFPINIFDKVEYVDEILREYSLVLREYPRSDLIRLPISARAINDRESFQEMMTETVAFVILEDVFNLLDFNDVDVVGAEEYWEVLKRHASVIIENNDVPILIVSNPTKPAWIFDWQFEESSGGYKRPLDMKIAKDEKNSRDYIFNINEIMVYVAPIESGRSVLLSKSTFDSLAFTRLKDNVFVSAKSKDVVGSGTLVDLSLSFYREVKIKNKSALRISFGSEI